MSIRIKQDKCIGCGLCMEVCPGNLIKRNAEGKACIKHEEDCWGCTSCLKECQKDAIAFFLGADIGGKGSTLSVHTEGNVNVWKVEDIQGNVQTIEVNKKDANKY